MPSEFRNTILGELGAGLLSLERTSQRRSLLRPAGVNLCSNDYLGLAQNEELRAAIMEAVLRSESVGGTGSRLLSGHFAIWEEVESEFAEFAGTEAALYFGSGYAANLGLLTALLGKNDLVFSDELNHASIIDGIRLSGARKEIYAHRDLNALEGALKRFAAERCRKIVVTESVFSMDGDIADVAAMVALAERYGASVIVDEAHATAVHGPGGRGIVASAGLTNRALAVVHTCGKALASAGAFVCGSRVLREHLINHARTFVFSTAMPPYMAGQVRAALRLARGMDRERRMLLANAARLRGASRMERWDGVEGERLSSGAKAPLSEAPASGLKLRPPKEETIGAAYVRSEAEPLHAASMPPREEIFRVVSMARNGEICHAAALLFEESSHEPSCGSQIVPVIVGSNEEALSAAEWLQGKGFAVRAIRPPTVPAGKARLRFSLTSLVPRTELDRLASSLYEWRTRNLVPSAVEQG